MDVATWLRGLGLEQYAPVFRDNDIDAAVLPELTVDDLIGLGVSSIGHRRMLLSAIAALQQASASDDAPPPSPVPTEPADIATAERRLLTIMFCDRAFDSARSRGFAGRYRYISPRCQRRSEPVPGLYGQVYGRRHPRLFRLPAGA
jgi:hypothetical protein